MSNKIAELLRIIQSKTDESLDTIANKLGYSRPHLNNAKNSTGNFEKVEAKLMEVYGEVLKNYTPSDKAVRPDNGDLPEYIIFLKDHIKYLKDDVLTRVIQIESSLHSLDERIRDIQQFQIDYTSGNVNRLEASTLDRLVRLADEAEAAALAKVRAAKDHRGK